MNLSEDERSLKIKGGIYILNSFTGRLLETTTRTTQEITGHGGGGVIQHSPGAGFSQVHTDPVEIETTTKTYRELYLLDNNGKERDFELVDFNVRCRAGHVLSVVSATKTGKSATDYIAVYNHNTEKFNVNRGFLFKRLKPRLYPLWFALAGMALMAIAPLPGILGDLQLLIVPIIGGLGGAAIGSYWGDSVGWKRVDELHRQLEASPLAKALNAVQIADYGAPAAGVAVSD